MGRSKKGMKTEGWMKPHRMKITLLLCFGVGFLLGVLLAHYEIGFEHTTLQPYVDRFLHQFRPAEYTRATVLKESLLKYGLFMVLTWFLGYLTAGAIGALGLLFVKGIGYGFTLTLLVSMYRGMGFFYMLVLTLPQGILLIPAYFFICYSCLRFIFTRMEQKGDHRRKAVSFSILEYSLILMLCLSVTGLAALYEAFAIPWVFENLISSPTDSLASLSIF